MNRHLHQTPYTIIIMMRYINLLILVVAFGSLFSCVANRKYQEEVTARNAAQSQAQQSEAARREAEEQLEKAQQELKEAEKEFNTLEKDYALVKERYEQQQKLNKDLQASYDKLLELNEKLTAEAAGRKRELDEELTRKESELRRKESELERRERDMLALQQKLEAERAEIERLQASVGNLEGDKSALMKDLEAREARVKELEAAVAARDAKANALKNKLAQALLGFESSDLSVEMRNGKVYVSLSQNLLFSSGSAKLDKKGIDALEKLAKVLQNNKEINVLVEGHTDSDGEEKMNWELSTERSLSIVYQLIKNNVAPKRITAAGRGEHMPIASNDSDAGKARNRRTDIILTPQLDEVLDILQKD